MPYSGQRIVLVCEDEDARLLASSLGGGAFQSASPSSLPDDADVTSAPAILWVRPADLTAPGDRDTVQYRGWLQFWTLYSDRVIVRLFRVTHSIKRGSQVSFLSEADAWLESAKEIQSQVRSFASCSIVVFERQPAQVELEQLNLRSETSTIYLMMPRLRVSREEKQQAFSMYIWPSAVTAVLQRLAVSDPKSSLPVGLFAWRSFSVLAEIDSGPAAVDSAVVDDFIQWIKELQVNDAERRAEASGSRASAPLEALRDPGEKAKPPSPVAVPAGTVFEAFTEWLGDRLARLRRMVKADDLVAATSAGVSADAGPDSKVTPQDRLVSTVEQNDLRMLADFRGLLAGPEREPRGIVERITDLSLVARQAVGVGGAIRRQASGMYHSPIDAARREKEWKRVSVEKPPLGGPGLLPRIQFSADTQIGLTREREIVGRMLLLWERELSRRLRDHETEKRFLGRCADQLALARRSMIALGPRVLLALLTAVMLTATLLQGLRLWIQPQGGLWSAQEVTLALLFALMTGAGAVVGTCIPYLLELSRGRRAGAALGTESAAVVYERIAILNRRLVLSSYAQQIMAPNLAGLGRAKLVSHLAARTWTICQDAFERARRQQGGLEPIGATAEEDSLDGPGRFSRRAYQQLCVYRLKLSAKTKSDPLSPAAEREQWSEYLDVWVQAMPRNDFKAAGWMPRDVIVRLLDDALLKVRRSRLDIQDPEHVRLSNQRSFEDALQRWSPKGGQGALLGKNLGMMSLHFPPESQVEALTLVVGRGSLGEELSGLLRTHCDLDRAAKVVSSDSLASLNGSLVALVFQETRVEFQADAAKEAESDGFVPVPRTRSREETPDPVVPA